MRGGGTWVCWTNKREDDDVDDYTKQFCYYIILQLGWVWKENNNNNKRIEKKRRREKKSSCLLSVSYVCLLFVHVSPSGYLNANEGDHDGLGCSQSRLHIINIHVSLSRSLCVCLGAGNVALVRLHRMKKRSIPFRTSDFLFVSFLFVFLSLQPMIARPAKKLIHMKILWTIIAAQISVSHSDPFDWITSFI